MLAEVAGKQTASIHLTETAKMQKDMIGHCLAGTGGRKTVEGWKPRYFRFPMQAYTKRKFAGNRPMECGQEEEF